MNELTTDLLARAAGWQVMKEARALLAAGRVREATWEPPHLRGSVQEGPTVYRAGLVIRGPIDIDNLCSCRRSQTDGALCAHSVAVGLQILAPAPSPAAVPTPSPSDPGHRPPGATPSPPRLPSPRPARGLRLAAAGQAGESLRLHLILPPNLATAIHRGRIMVACEGEWRHARRPINALPRDLPFLLEPADTRCLEALETLANIETPGMLLLPEPDFVRLLPTLAGHPRITLGRGTALTVTTEPRSPLVNARLLPEGEIELRCVGAAPAILRGEGAPWLLAGHCFSPLLWPDGCPEPSRGPVRIRRPQVPAFLDRHWPVLAASAHATADFSPADFDLATLSPQIHLHLTGSLQRLQAVLEFDYGTTRIRPGTDAPEPCFPDPADTRRYHLRDVAAEQQALGRLARAGFDRVDRGVGLDLDGPDAVFNFLAREFPRLEREWTVRIDAVLGQAIDRRCERIQPQFAATPSGEQWFDLAVTFASASGDRFSPADIQRLILSRQSHRRLSNGRIALLDTGAVEELQQVLQDCDPQQGNQGYRLASSQAGFVASTLAEAGGWALQAPAPWLQRMGVAGSRTPSHMPPLGPLETVLRPYQREGVAWIWSLRNNGFSGVLADEMGLGKTLQVLAALAALRPASATPPASPPSANSPRSPDPANPEHPLPWLVVCPTSLVSNWEAEARRFAPHLRVLALQGPDRHAAFQTIPQADLVVTSYALVRRDAERYPAFAFDTVVLDEAQHIKNRQTQNAQAVKSVRSQHRLVLTGTPLENSVLDLWSLFDFLMPGFLGSARDFRERYEVPITRDADDTVQTRLARRLRPFVLRRLKRHVAADLPPRLDQVAYCDLAPAQADLYRQILEAGRREMLETAGASHLPKQRMLVLTTLLRLRQVCCDPRLLDLPETESPPPSAKIELLDELLDEALDGGHRVLIFSQFTRLLGLVRERLTAAGLEFCYLDGSTQNRAAEVQRFQTSPSVPVFLISLKAGGVGLNLTAADTVLLLDPWWNPAVEAQAADRAHRIGQTRTVTSYRLIARGTVEEKMLRLQERKKRVFTSTLGDEEALMSTLDFSDLQALL